MKKWIWGLGVALFLGGMATLVWASPPRGHSDFWKSERVIEKLGLTAEQVENLGEVEYEFQKANIELEARIRVARLSLERLLGQDKMKKQEVEALVGEISQSRKEQAEALWKMRVEARQVLTLDQWKEFEKAQRRLAKKGREARRRGPDPRAIRWRSGDKPLPSPEES